MPLEELDDAGIAWWRGCLEKDLADDGKSRFHGKARRDLAALDAEIAFRASPPPAPADDGPPPGWDDGGDPYGGKL